MPFRIASLALPLMCLLLAAHTCAGQVPPTQKGVSEQPNGASPSAPTTTFVTPLAKPISPADIQRYGQILNLSDPQRAFLDTMYARYIEQAEHWKQNRVSAVRDMAQITANEMNRNTGPSGAGCSPYGVSLYAEFIKMVLKIERELESADSELFDQLSTVLARAQLESLPRVQWHRQRARCNHFQTMRAARLDLSQMVEEMQLPDDAMDSMRTVMSEYEAAITPLMTRYDQDSMKNGVESYQALADLDYSPSGEFLEDNTPAAKIRGDIYLQRMSALAAGPARLERRVCDINRQFLPRYLEVLPEPRRGDFRERFQMSAYPKVYPDLGDPTPLIREIIRSEHLQEQDRALLEAVLTSFTDSYELVNTKMVTEYESWCEHIAATGNNVGYVDYRQNMRDLRAKRFDRARGFVKQLKDLLPIDQYKAENSMLDDFLATLEVRIQRGQTDDFPGNPGN